MHYRVLFLLACLLLPAICTLSAGADRSLDPEVVERAAARVEEAVIAPSTDRTRPLFAFSRTRIVRPGLAARFTWHLQEDAAARAFLAFTLHQRGGDGSPQTGETGRRILAWGCYYPATDDVFVGRPEVGFVVASSDSLAGGLGAADRSRCTGGG